MLSRRQLFQVLAAGALAPAAAWAAPSVLPLHSVTGPLDHADPLSGTREIGYVQLAPFDRRKPTVFVLADGQQYFVSPQAFAAGVGAIFGERFNVVGVLARSEAPEIQARVRSGADVDWREAWRLLKADQWLDDIEHVRRAVVGPAGRVRLYGRSGGGLLVHQYLARYGDRAAGAFTQAALNNFLEAQFGLASDRFWEELSETDRSRLGEVLRHSDLDRPRLAQLFQRQNFFVDRAALSAARTALIANLAEARLDRLAPLERDYQVEAIAELERGPRGPAIHVRLFEFFAPLAADFRVSPSMLRPDLEVQARYAEPLLRLLQRGEIDAPAMDFAALSRVKADVFLLAGRWDHTCDYRSQIALAASYPSHRLVILDDDHTFHSLQAAGTAPALVQGALSGFGSTPFVEGLARIAPLRWREDGASA